jgi:predicted nucleotidyltransferase
MKQTIINKLQTFFPAYPVEKAWVFGSYARGEEKPKSDIDVMVRFDGNATITLIDYSRIMNDLSDCLHTKVD